MEQVEQSIFLVGLPGSGKSVFGKRLAKHLGYTFLDLDEMIVQETGLSIADVFSSNGEAYFREIEQKCLRQTSQLTKHVIASGGGTPCYFDNMQWMNQHGVTIFLDISIETIAERLLSSKNLAKRPLLAQNADKSGLIEKLANLLLTRISFYAQAKLKLKAPDLEAVEEFIKGKMAK